MCEAIAHPVVCAWCGVSLRAGNPTLPLSHGICGPCKAKVFAEEKLTETALLDVSAAVKVTRDAAKMGVGK